MACLYDEADASQEPATEAITNIDSWVNREGAQPIYAHFGMDIGLDQYIPGVTEAYSIGSGLRRDRRYSARDQASIPKSIVS